MHKGSNLLILLLIGTLIAVPTKALWCMQPDDISERTQIIEYQKSLNLQQFDAVKAGIAEVNKGNYWKAISINEPCFRTYFYS